MQILITGGCGYLGSALAQLLLRKGYGVRVLDNLMHGPLPVWSFIGEHGYEFMSGDVRDRDAVRNAVRGVDAIIHLAAIVGDPACSQDPVLAREVNLEGSANLIDAARNENVKHFVFASTCSNYGKLPEQSKPATEDFVLSPLSLYAETKVEIENTLLNMKSGALKTTILRFATLYGLSPRMRFDLTVNEFVLRMQLERRLVVYGKQFWRPYVHVRDAARAVEIVLAADETSLAHRVFNVGDSAENYTKLDLVEIITRRLGASHVEFIHKAEDPRDYRVCCDRIMKTLNFSITRTVSDGVDEIVRAIDAGLVDRSMLDTNSNTPSSAHRVAESQQI